MASPWVWKLAIRRGLGRGLKPIAPGTVSGEITRFDSAVSRSTGYSFALSGALVAAVVALALAARAQGAHWVDSVALYRRGAAMEPGSYLMNFGLGGALLRAGRIAEAEPAFRAAIAIHPASARARAMLGFVLASTGHAPEAEEQYREALRLDPGDEYALFLYAEMLRRSGLADRARPLYEALLERSSQGNEDLRKSARRALGK